MKRRALLGVLLATMLVLQMGLAVRHSLWADEVFSLAMATGHSVEHSASRAQPELGDFVESDEAIPPAELRKYAEFSQPPAGVGRVLRAIKLSDTSPPLYYVILHAWMRLWGTSDLALRTLSILFSLGCVPLIFALGREVESEKTGCIAATLFALAPVSLYYSVEGRMYSLLWFCVLMTAFATIRLYRGARGIGWQLGWVAASAAGLLVHYYFVFPWAALGFFLLWRNGADRRWLLVIRVAVVVGLILPWYLQLPELLSQWRITQNWVEWKPPDYERLRVVRNVVAQYFSGYGHYLWPTHRMAELVALGIFVAAAATTMWRSRLQVISGPKVMLFLWFLAACLGPVFADVVRGTYIAPYLRYTSAALPAACLLGGLVLSAWRPSVVCAAIAVIVASWSPSLAEIYRSRSRSGQPTADVAKHVSEFGGENGLVLVHSIPTGAIGLARYSTSPAAFGTWIGQLGQRRVPESLLKMLEGRSHVSLVKIHTVGEPAPEEVWLRENANVIKEKKLGDAFITEFEPRGAERF